MPHVSKLGFAKLVFCNRVLFTKTTGLTKTSHTATNKGVHCVEVTEAPEMAKTTGIQGVKHRFHKT